MSKHEIYLYPVWLRIWHGVNALCIILLIISGISMQYGNLNLPLLPFKTSVIMHNYAGVIASVGYVVFVINNFITDNYKQYVLTFKGVGTRLMKQTQYYLSGYFKGEPKPFPISADNKFNPLQRVSYIVAMYAIFPFLVITGLALLFPEVIVTKVFNIGGVQLTAIFHSILGFFLSLFLVIHLYVASIGKNPLRNYKSIVNGYHVDEEH